MMDYIRYIRIDRILPNLRLCYSHEEIEELGISVCSRGQLEPILLSFDGEYFRIIDGEKRWRACRKKEIAVLKAVIKEVRFES
jgi:ParB family chromosome partitioning protein